MDEQELMIKELEAELKLLRVFKEYFDELYGLGLEIIGMHYDQSPEPFDNIYEDACGDI